MQISVKVAKAIERRRVFVVDDNETFRAAIEFMLHDEYEAHELASASETLAKAEQIRPDLLVLAEGVIRVNGLGSHSGVSGARSRNQNHRHRRSDFERIRPGVRR